MRAAHKPPALIYRVFALLFALVWIFSGAAPAGHAAGRKSGLESRQAAAQSIPSLGVVQQWSLTAPDPGLQAAFGYAVALDGSTAVIGERNADLDLGGGLLKDAGAAYVYTYNGKTWLLQARLTAKDASAGDTFGVSVAISGNRILVGATGVDLTDPGEKSEQLKDAGAAYVFTRSGSTWTQQVKLTAPDPVEEDAFGSGVAIDGGTAVVAAETKDLMPLLDLGAAYVFYNSGGKEWKVQAKLLPPDPYLGDYFGSSVAIYGNRIAVGAIQVPPIGESGPGKAYIFRRSGGIWSPEAKLKAQGGESGDGFGSAIALYGSTVVVGAPFADPDLGYGRVASAGEAYVFDRSGSTWKENTALTAADGMVFNHFGNSVDIYNDLIVVGADGATQAGNSGSGAAYIFQKKQKAWNPQTRAVTDPTQEDDLFGKSVAVSRDWFVAGASGRDPESVSGAGQAFLNKLGPVQLPETGFTPGLRTKLPAQPAALTYQSVGITLEIPSLGTRLPIRGVPRSGSGWDVRWLGESAGYLEGTAFPTWTGNTGLAAHSTLPDGSPGPFARLGDLRWGDQVVLHAFGQRYIYEVRQNSLAAPGWTTGALKHEKLDWITLITCQGYDEANDSYRWRRVVRAVLVSVQPE